MATRWYFDGMETKCDANYCENFNSLILFEIPIESVVGIRFPNKLTNKHSVV